jgi:RNA polymerase sigma-70 factor (ECF subfamily)
VEAQLPTLTPVFADHVDASQVLSALAKVDELFQPAVALFYLEDCSYKDIAAILGVPIGTVKSRIARGVAQLRELLLPDGGVPERGHAGAERDLSPTPFQEPLRDS